MKIITQSYLSLLNSFLFLSRFSVSLKSLNNYFFKRFAYKSIHNRFSVLINHIMWSSNHFSTSSCFLRFLGSRLFRAQVFQGPGFSGSGSRFQKQLTSGEFAKFVKKATVSKSLFQQSCRSIRKETPAQCFLRTLPEDFFELVLYRSLRNKWIFFQVIGLFLLLMSGF